MSISHAAKSGNNVLNRKDRQPLYFLRRICASKGSSVKNVQVTQSLTNIKTITNIFVDIITYMFMLCVCVYVCLSAV